MKDDDFEEGQQAQKSKFFSKETDNLLLKLTNKVGYGNWAEIKRSIRREPRYRFDHLFVSRSEEEIKKRVIYLVQMIVKEDELNAPKEA